MTLFSIGSILVSSIALLLYTLQYFFALFPISMKNYKRDISSVGDSVEVALVIDSDRPRSAVNIGVVVKRCWCPCERLSCWFLYQTQLNLHSYTLLADSQMQEVVLVFGHIFTAAPEEIENIIFIVPARFIADRSEWYIGITNAYFIRLLLDSNGNIQQYDDSTWNPAALMLPLSRRIFCSINLFTSVICRFLWLNPHSYNVKKSWTLQFSREAFVFVYLHYMLLRATCDGIKYSKRDIPGKQYIEKM